MASHRPVVAVTGASGYVGIRLLNELQQDEGLAQVVAIDTRSLPVPFHNVSTERLDVTDTLDHTFENHRVTAAVHLAFILRPGHSRSEIERVRNANLQGMRSFLAACHANKVSNVIFLSSHTTYGAHRDNPVPITEEAPVRPSEDFQYALEKGLCEEMAEEYAARHPDTCVTVLRSCVVMGPGADNYITRAFFRKVLIGIRGYDPPMQFLHEDDLARLLHRLIVKPVPGTFNVAGEGVIRYSRIARLSRRRLFFLPSFIAFPLTQMAWRLGIQKDSPATGLNFVRYPLVLSTGKLKKETGFRFHYTSEDALMAYLPDIGA